jgi:hypothetical protein
VSTYTIFFFTNRREPSKATAIAASEKAQRGGLKPVAEHFCGVDECKSVNGGCHIRRKFKVACTYAGDYTWPKD